MTEQLAPTIDMEKFKVTTNGIVDYMAYLILENPDILLPEEMKQYFQKLNEETGEMEPNLDGVKVTDICYSRNDLVDENGAPIGTLIRMGSRRASGTLISVFELGQWFSKISPEEVPQTLEWYQELCGNQPSEVV